MIAKRILQCISVRAAIVHSSRYFTTGASLQKRSGEADFMWGSHTKSLLPHMSEDFAKNGYLIVRKVLNQDELDVAINTVNELVEAKSRGDVTSGGLLKIHQELISTDATNTLSSQWTEAAEDIIAYIAHSGRLVNMTSSFLGGPVYPYLTKLILKEAETCGEIQWHQDYWFWYRNGCVRPTMLAAFTALSHWNPSLGSFKVLPFTHKLGRLDHVPSDSFLMDYVADRDRVQYIREHYEEKAVTLEPGDVVFWDCCTIHSMEENLSEIKNRRALVTYYNRKDNLPITTQHKKHSPEDHQAVHKFHRVAEIDLVNFVKAKKKKAVKE